MQWQIPYVGCCGQTLALIVTAIICIYVMSKYFSGGQYKGVKGSLQGKVAVITGGNSGIGKQTAKDMAKHGCSVVIGARDTKKSEEVVSWIKKETGSDKVVYYKLDLGDAQSIRDFVSHINHDKIDFLINNAGVMALPKRTTTKDGFEFQYGINHLGHFYLTHLLWNKLHRSPFFRIINVSSLAHRKAAGFFITPKLNFEDMNFQKQKYASSLSYSRSKLYNVLFTKSLASKVSQDQGVSYCLHPGVVRTQLTRYVFAGVLGIIFKAVQPIFFIFTKSAWEGAQTTLALVYTPTEKLKNGGYYADCALSTENKEVTQQNARRLWEISERDLGITFGQ